MKLRNELADKVNKHFEKIGANTDDIFKYGFDACEARYLPMLEKLEDALNDITEFNIRIEHSRFDSRSFQDIAKQALAELTDFKNKMNGEK